MGRPGRARGLEQGPLDEEAAGEDVRFEALLVGLPGRLGDPDLDHLPGVVPLIDGRGHVEPLVALEAHELAAEGRRQDLADLSLAHPRLALEEQGTAELQGQEDGRRQAAVGHVVARAEQRQRIIDGPGKGGGRGCVGVLA